jgi:polysaccharide biosynthesis transport protein
MDIGEFVSIAMRRRRLLAPCMIIAGALCLGYILFTPTRYTASMSLLIDPRERMPLGIDAAPMPQNPDAALVESQMRILTSKTVLRRVVDSQGLASDPDYAPGMISQLLSGVTGLFSRRPAAPEARVDALAEALGREITTRRGERTYIIDVDVKGRTPDGAVKLAKALTDAYFAAQAGMTDEIAARQTAWLDGRLNDLRTRVESAERRAQDYRDAQSIVASDGHLSPEEQLRAANDALVAARGKRSDIEARYLQLKSAMARGGKSESINDSINSPVIEKLRADQSALARDEAYERSVLGPRHPSYLTTKMQLGAIQKQIAAELQRIELASERELRSAKATEQDAAGLVTTLESATSKLGDSRVELGQLESQAASLRASYEKMLTARENVKRDIVESPNTTIVDPPVAGPGKTSPKTTLAAFIAFAGGLNLWILAALIAEYRESRRPFTPTAPAPLAGRTKPADRSAPASTNWFALDAPTFDAARYSGSQADGRQPLAGVTAVERAMQGDARYSGSIDAILQELNERGGAGEAAPVIAVASQARGAGASTIVLSLAYSACASGTRVLLVDRDCEQPGLTFATRELRRAPLGKPGQVARVVHRDERTDGEILLVPFDARGPFALDAHLRSRFGLILLDCGPLANENSALVECGALLIVVETAADEQGVASLLDALDFAGRKVGVIRNGAPERLRESA